MSEFILERYIAIDNVCAWPNLTRLPDGSIATAIFNQPCHGHWQGDVDVHVSEDDGRLWQYRGTAAPHDGTTVRMNVAAGCAHNGDLVVLASGWGNHTMTRAEHKLACAKPGFVLDRGQTLRPWVCRSSDSGRTWQVDKDAFPEREVDQFVPFGDIQLGEGNQLHACAYHRFGEGSDQAKEYRSASFFTSEDDGRTWTETGNISNGDNNETTLLHLEGSRWMVASRTAVAKQLDQYISEDNGKTWQRDQQLSMPSQVPGHLLRLSDGRILLTYGVRNPGCMGLHFRVSDDNAKTWSRPIALVTYPNCDHGYPSTVENKDGTLTTAWYAAKHPDHNRYHMAVAIWKLPI